MICGQITLIINLNKKNIKNSNKHLTQRISVYKVQWNKEVKE
jgi:hypothetical protein